MWTQNWAAVEDERVGQHAAWSDRNGVDAFR